MPRACQTEHSLEKEEMGYTHYYRVEDPSSSLKTREIAADLRLMHLRSEWPLSDGAGTPGGVPQFGPEGIEFNGIGEERLETFQYPPCARQNQQAGLHPGFGYCKTAHRPYDTFVAAALLVIKHHLGEGVSIYSDGSPAGREWRRAIDLFQHVYPGRDAAALARTINT